MERITAALVFDVLRDAHERELAMAQAITGLPPPLPSAPAPSEVPAAEVEAPAADPCVAVATGRLVSAVPAEPPSLGSSAGPGEHHELPQPPTHRAPAPVSRPPPAKLDLEDLFGNGTPRAERRQEVDLFSGEPPTGPLFGSSTKREAAIASKRSSLFGDDDDPLFAKK